MVVSDYMTGAPATQERSVPQWDPTVKVADEELLEVGAAIRVIASTTDAIITGSSRPVVKVWKFAEGKLSVSHRLKHGAVGSSCVEVAGNGVLLAVCSDDGGIGFWDIRDKKRVGELASSISTAWKVKFLPDGQRLVSGGTSGTVAFWDLRMRCLESQIAADGGVSAPKFEDVPVKRRKTERGVKSKMEGNEEAETTSIIKPPSPVFSLCCSSDCLLLGCGRASGDVSVMRLDNQQWVRDVTAHQSQKAASVRAMAFDATSRLLLSGGDDHHVCILDADNWARPRANSEERRCPQQERFSAHRGWVTSLSTCPAPAHRVAITTSWDATVKLWDFATHALLQTYKEHTDSVFASAFAPGDGRFFVTAGADAQLSLYTMKSEAALVPFSS